ncbi:protein translocase subunit SecA-like [Hemibagrus wyckioides]|uniref:protein translocase subunit SecA-like n=1 Tax=Hemibagrus wyckioides TaxID=337641 RepID=UPI00266B8B05|nr:protein translocase subunit SecA-like [Hemibagrus wyckioides]
MKLIIPMTFLKTFYINVKYGDCSESDCCKNPHLWYVFNPKDDPSFTIRESGDHQEIHLDCNRNYEKRKSTCPNYGKIEDDAREEEERKRQEKEEQRRQAQLEREKRIEEQIQRESELAAEKLSQATETLKQKQRLRGHELHHQTYIMQQTINTEIERDEVAEIEEKFSDLLCEYRILEEEDSEETLAGRMKTLQNELMVEYCKKHNLSSSCVFSFDTSVGYETLPLQDRLTVLEAIMYLVFEEDENDHKHKHNRDFLLDVLELLQDDHPSLAFNLLQSVLQTDIQLSTQSKDILCRIAFNNTWKLPEITDFMRYVVGKDKDHVQAILHIAQTYKLEYEIVLHALDSPDPPRRLKWHVDTERDKNANTIISEMRNSNYPENVLTILEDVLVYLEMELQKHKRTDLHKNEIQHVKKMVKELDFTNPDRQVLKSVLVQMSVAVKMCSALTIQRGKEEIVIEGYLPRLTQLATLMVFLLPKSKTNTGCLLEIGTGEGKSCILAMLAVIHAIRGVKVDIVTSSPILACRDLEEWSKLYNMFDITSSAVPPMLNDVSSEEQDDLTQEAYKQDVVYSTVGTFAADTLKQEFENKTSRGDRKFELVLVDEVDYMTLDNGVQITFLSHESSGLQHLEQVLASIWAIISACRPIEVEETGETMWTTRVQNFHTAALIAMIGSDTNDTFSPLEILLPGIELGFYSEEDFENLKVSINEEGEKEHGAIENEALKTIMAKTGIEQQYDLLKVLEMGMEHKVAFNCYIYQSETRKAFQFGEQKTKTDQNINMLLLENGKSCEILAENLLIEATISEVKSKIKYSKQCSSEEDKESLVIPSFLEKYLDSQLPLFVENALKAIQMTKGREYMIERSLSAQGIDVDEDGEHMYHAIIPVDFQASGMLEKRKRWGDGLQQFLEMKHQLTLSPLSNVTNYMSNSNFFKRYLRGKGIFGVSGTLGGDADKGFLARHYKTDSYVIPAHQRQKVTELPAVQVRGGTEQWIQTICDTVTRVSKRGQVVLVVCEDVNTANALNDKIAAENKHPVTMYTMSESHNIENQEFNKGQIIISTNLGGRGTDIKVTEEVNRCGGLFVLLTYFPNNRRVEKQVFG